MKKILYLISLVLTRIAPLLVIFARHIIEDGGGLNLTIIGGFLAVVTVYFAWYRPLAKKVDVWEIQGDNDIFVINFRHMKIMLVFGLIYFTFLGISNNIELALGTVLYMSLFFFIGWIARIFSV